MLNIMKHAVAVSDLFAKYRDQWVRFEIVPVFCTPEGYCTPVLSGEQHRANVWTVYGRHEDGRALALHDAPQPDQAAAWLAAQLARD